MALVRTVTHECDRCMFGKVKQATHLNVRLIIEGEQYEGDLCDEHYALFRQDQAWWRKSFRRVDEPDVVVDLDAKRRFVTTDEVDRARRAADLRAADAAKREAESAARQAARQAAAEALRAGALDIERLRRSIPGARSWTITAHARQRMAERNFTAEEVLRTVAAPQVNYEDPQRPGRWVYVRNDCRAIVDPRGKTVITVIDRNDHWDVRPGAERIAQ